MCVPAQVSAIFCNNLAARHDIAVKPPWERASADAV